MSSSRSDACTELDSQAESLLSEDYGKAITVLRETFIAAIDTPERIEAAGAGNQRVSYQITARVC